MVLLAEKHGLSIGIGRKDPPICNEGFTRAQLFRPFVMSAIHNTYTYTANLYRDYREFTGITCTLYRVFPVTGKNL